MAFNRVFIDLTYENLTYFIVLIVSIYYALFSTFYYVTLYENYHCWKKICIVKVVQYSYHYYQ